MGSKSVCSVDRQNGGNAVIICTTWWCFYDKNKIGNYTFLGVAAEAVDFRYSGKDKMVFIYFT